MALNFDKIKNVSAETRSIISRKSAESLPNNPSERGYSAETIKRRFYQPILDAANSALAEIDRVVNEANITFGQVSDELDNFIETTKIKEAYKVVLDNTRWTLNNDTNMYELYILKDEHGIEDYKEIGVNMFLLDGNGKYTQVNQFEIGIDGTVRCFHETNGAGYLSIYVKREGFIVGGTIVDADHIVGLSKVGKSNNYEDLDNKPNISKISDNEIMISKIISGVQTVNSAVFANESKISTYAETSGSSDHSNLADAANKAEADQYGVNIHNGYAKQNGNYSKMTVGRSNNSDKADADEDGVNIKTNYAKQNGTYLNMCVGESKKAETAQNAEISNMAISDENGLSINTTYAKVTGSYPKMSVNAATYADKAKMDASGNIITDTYTKGRTLEREFITFEVRVGKSDDGTDSKDLFNDNDTTFTIPAYVSSKIDGSDKRILFAVIQKKLEVSSNRYDPNYLFLRINGIDNLCYPTNLRLTSDDYNFGLDPNTAYAPEINSTVTINNKTFIRYSFYDTTYNFDNGRTVMFEIFP